MLPLLPFLLLFPPAGLTALTHLAGTFPMHAVSWNAEPALGLVALAPVLFFGSIGLIDRLPTVR